MPAPSLGVLVKTPRTAPSPMRRTETTPPSGSMSMQVAGRSAGDGAPMPADRPAGTGEPVWCGDPASSKSDSVATVRGLARPGPVHGSAGQKEEREGSWFMAVGIVLPGTRLSFASACSGRVRCVMQGCRVPSVSHDGCGEAGERLARSRRVRTSPPPAPIVGSGRSRRFRRWFARTWCFAATAAPLRGLSERYAPTPIRQSHGASARPRCHSVTTRYTGILLMRARRWLPPEAIGPSGNPVSIDRNSRSGHRLCTDVSHGMRAGHARSECLFSQWPQGTGRERRKIRRMSGTVITLQNADERFRRAGRTPDDGGGQASSFNQHAGRDG